MPTSTQRVPISPSILLIPILAIICFFAWWSYLSPSAEAERILRDMRRVKTLEEADEFAAKYRLSKHGPFRFGEDSKQVAYYDPGNPLTLFHRNITCTWLLEVNGRAKSFTFSYSRRASWESRSTSVNRSSGVPDNVAQ
jgi:hypothetical protein